MASRALCICATSRRSVKLVSTESEKNLFLEDKVLQGSARKIWGVLRGTCRLSSSSCDVEVKITCTQSRSALSQLLEVNVATVRLPLHQRPRCLRVAAHTTHCTLVCSILRQSIFVDDTKLIPKVSIKKTHKQHNDMFRNILTRLDLPTMMCHRSI